MGAADPGVAVISGRFGGVGWEGGRLAAVVVVGGTETGIACCPGEAEFGRGGLGWVSIDGGFFGFLEYHD